jgi:hypothetical protein
MQLCAPVLPWYCPAAHKLHDDSDVDDDVKRPAAHAMHAVAPVAP